MRHVLILAVALTFAACDRPAVLVETTPGKPGSSTGDNRQPSFALVDASLSIDGEETGARVNLSDDTFTYLFVYLDEVGLFMISTEPFGPTQEAGAFVDNTLTVDHAGVTIEFVSGTNILSEPTNRSAWVEFTADFQMFDPGTRPANVVIGLADDRNQIPGFDRKR